MVLALQTPTATIIGNATRGPFNLVDADGVPIRLSTASHVKVLRFATVTTPDADAVELVYGVDFTIGGTTDARTLTLTSLQAVLTSAQRLRVDRVQGISQDLSIGATGQYDGPAIMAAMDRMAEQIQELKRELDRRPQMDWRQTTPLIMPLAPATGTELLGRNAAGLVSIPLSDVGGSGSGEGGDLEDGDYVDITVDGPVWSINPSVVTYAKIQDLPARSLLGRAGNSTGVSAAIAGSAGLPLTDDGATLAFRQLALAAFPDNLITPAKMAFASAGLLGCATSGAGAIISLNATLAISGGALQRAALTGDVTASAGSNATSITAEAVTFAKVASAAIQTDPSFPTNSNSKFVTEAAVKSAIEAAADGIQSKSPVRVATTTNGTFASAFDDGSTVDGVTLATGDRILIKDRTDATTNGIYVVQASGAPVRATDADAGTELRLAEVLVLAGSVNANANWKCTTTGTITLGSSNITWTQTGAGGTSSIADGDKGDITTSGSGLVWVIDADAVTYDKMQNVSATSRVLGRITSGAGNVEELTGTNVRTICGLTTSSNVQFAAVIIDTYLVFGSGAGSQMASGSGGLDGVFIFCNNALTDFDRIAGGGVTSAFPALVRSGAKWKAMLADKSALTAVEVADEAFGAAWNGKTEAPTKNAIYDGLLLATGYTRPEYFGAVGDGSTDDYTAFADMETAIQAGTHPRTVLLTADVYALGQQWTTTAFLVGKGSTGLTGPPGLTARTGSTLKRIGTTTTGATVRWTNVNHGNWGARNVTFHAGGQTKTAVRVATTANGTLATAYENSDTLDGVVLATNDRILLKNQTTASENGIYIVQASGAPTRATDADAGSEIFEAHVFVTHGSTNANTGWKFSNTSVPTVGSTNLTFASNNVGPAIAEFAVELNGGEGFEFTNCRFYDGRTASIYCHGVTASLSYGKFTLCHADNACDATHCWKFDGGADEGNPCHITLDTCDCSHGHGVAHTGQGWYFGGCDNITLIQCYGYSHASIASGKYTVDIEPKGIAYSGVGTLYFPSNIRFIGLEPVGGVGVRAGGVNTVQPAQFEMLANDNTLSGRTGVTNSSSAIVPWQDSLGVWHGKPAFHATLAGDQSSVDNLANERIEYATEVEDVGGFYNAGLSTFVAPTSGYMLWDISMNVNQNISQDAVCQLRLYKDGAAVVSNSSTLRAMATNEGFAKITALVKVVAGSSYTPYAYIATTGGSNNGVISSDTGASYCKAAYI